MAQGLYEEGCRVATAYPGTPSTEILEALSAFRAPDLHLEWSVNEKVALEVACAASYTGLRTAVIMKQVGLNVALDPLMSLAYTGVVGGMLVIVADDPGPHSSQTEQDTRLFAMAAGLPVLDPTTPEDAREMVSLGYRISERYRLPVILRPLLRICHSRAPIPPPGERKTGPGPEFRKEVDRWAATPRHRLALHRELNEKLKRMTVSRECLGAYRYLCGEKGTSGLAVVASGVPASYALDCLREWGLDGIVPLVCVKMPYPFNRERVAAMVGSDRKVLVLEETGPFVELMLRGRLNVSGRYDGTVPSEGEMTSDTVAAALNRALYSTGTGRVARAETPIETEAPGREGDGYSETPPVLCAGCPHRTSFWALKSEMPRGIYAGDIGCYTLGRSLGAVDTVLCMGASISQAAGFYWAFRQGKGHRQPVAAVIGDSTFYHSGIPALVNAVQQGASFVVMILDNGTTAMTGGQPTPGTGTLADGGRGVAVPLEDLVRGCGVTEMWISDPLDYDGFVADLRQAARTAMEGKMAVIISRSPCVLEIGQRQGPVPELDMGLCSECRVCMDVFGCPAIVQEGDEIRIAEELCPGCGACVAVCPVGAIRPGEPE
ncbi:MAG: 4Fe-4S binding protein [bacterium]|nr:MAG: 4Fe-4S binding protein [bacterium]